MNSTLNLMANRRSIRFFSDQPVDDEQLRALAEAGHAAPSGSRRNWRFIIVTDPDFLAELREKAEPRYRAMMQGMPEDFQALRAQMEQATADAIYYSAPAVVFVAAAGMSADADGNLACGNIITAAEAMGLGSCYVWFGQLPVDDAAVRERMGLNEEEKIFGPIVVGHPAEQQPPAMPKGEPAILRI